MNKILRSMDRYPITVCRRPAGWAATLLLATAISGCTSFSADGGFGQVQREAEARLQKNLIWARTDAERALISERVKNLLARPLTMDDAVQLALLNNRGLQAAYAELGISEADYVQAGRLPNPGFGFARLTRGDHVEYERGFHLNLAYLVLMPWVQQIQLRRFEHTQRQVAQQTLSLADQVRKAWIQAVAAEESVRYLTQVKDAAEAGAELARRMAQVGNFNRLQQAREQSFYADAMLNLGHAEQQRRANRERLTRLLGLWGADTQFKLPERLPDLPEKPTDRPDVERQAMAQRLDVAAAKLGVEQTAANLGLTRVNRWVNVFELGLAHNSEKGEPNQHGWEVGLQLPLFDWGDARVAKAEAIYLQALNATAQVAIDARSEVREAYGAYRLAHDIARHWRNEVVPLKQRISEENLLRYNAMLIGVFELLADTRAQIASVNGAIGALRDYWIADSDLQMAMIGKPSLMAPAGAAMPMGESGGGNGH